jgi:hypothetical protein
MNLKHRLSASVDATVLVAAQTAVSDGRAANVSAWVNQALHRQAEHDARMRALDEFLSAYESAHGAITEDEIRGATRRARARAHVVRDRAAQPAPKRRLRAGAR